MAPKLVLTRGLPGAGKTHLARQWVNNAETLGRRVRVNRDDTRMNLFGAYVLSNQEENAVTKAQHASVSALLRSGHDVVVDDTNLSARTVESWYWVALDAGAEIEFEDVEVPLERVHEQNLMRDKAVAPEVITRFAQKNGIGANGKLRPPPAPPAAVAPYVPDETKPRAWLFDVDGTLALNTGGRRFYDWHRVSEDTPNPAIVRIGQLIGASDLGHDNHQDAIVVMSGREDVCLDDTLASVRAWGIEPAEIHMRRAGDGRKDAIVKAELFDAHVRDRWWVQGVFDDRDQVTHMWRRIGLTCLQVNYGDF